MPHTYLKARFQVGSSKADRLNYSLPQKVFHLSDVAEKILVKKREVERSVLPDWLELKPRPWNGSTSLATELRDRSKLKIKRAKAGLLDQPTNHPHAAYEELQRRLAGRETSKTSEAGWNQSVWVSRGPVKPGSCSVLTNNSGASDATKRPPVVVKEETYVTPEQHVTEIGNLIREKKAQYRDLREKIKEKLHAEIPNASSARLTAMASRLLDEKLLHDERNRRFPLPHENFRPNLALTTADRRFKVRHHPGSWTSAEKWSCCLQEASDAPGCDCRVVDPDRWCLEGFTS